MFTTNADFAVGGASRLAQKPLLLIDGHASRNLTPGPWVSADAYYSIGGEITLNYDRAVAKPVGQPDAQAIQLTVKQLW